GDGGGREGVGGNHRCCAGVVGIQVLGWQGVDIANDLDVVTIVANIDGFRLPTAGKFSLHAKLPASLPRNLGTLIKEGDSSAEIGLTAEGISDRLQNRRIRKRRRQRVGQRRTIRIGSEHRRGCTCITRLDHVATTLTQEAREKTEATSQYCLLVQLISKTETRQENVFRCFV